MTSPTAVTVSSAGVSAPTYAQILAYLKGQYQAIFGADVYLGNDSQDGQFLGIIAAAINDANAAAVAVYNSFSPATAQGNGLSSSVKINGLARQTATNSTVNLTIVGQAGTTIANGVAADTNGNLWNIPSPTVIPSGGSITVTATAQKVGAITAPVGTVTTISTPTYGWQSVTNASAASAGAPIETDAALRVRQGTSVALPSLTVLAGMVGAVQSLPGVVGVVPYENDTNATDTNGLPPHSIALVVLGGSAPSIAAAIMAKKTPGAYTYGTTSQVVTDSVGVPHTISYFVPTNFSISVAITMHALAGYTTAVAAEIQAAIAAYINALPIGRSVFITRLYLPAMLNGGTDSATYELVTLQACITGGSMGTTDIAIPFNGAAICLASNVSITIV